MRWGGDAICVYATNCVEQAEFDELGVSLVLVACVRRFGLNRLYRVFGEIK